MLHNQFLFYIINFPFSFISLLHQFLLYANFSFISISLLRQFLFYFNFSFTSILFYFNFSFTSSISLLYHFPFTLISLSSIESKITETLHRLEIFILPRPKSLAKTAKGNHSSGVYLKGRLVPLRHRVRISLTRTKKRSDQYFAYDYYHSFSFLVIHFHLLISFPLIIYIWKKKYREKIG